MYFRKLRRREGNTHVIQYISLTFKALNAYSQWERGNKQRNTICSLTPREYLCSRCFYFPKGSGPGYECVGVFLFYFYFFCNRASTTLTRHFRIETHGGVTTWSQNARFVLQPIRIAHVFFTVFIFFSLDENRDLNSHSDSLQIKRERSQVHYNGDASLYSNVSVSIRFYRSHSADVPVTQQQLKRLM